MYEILAAQQVTEIEPFSLASMRIVSSEVLFTSQLCNMIVLAARKRDGDFLLPNSKLLSGLYTSKGMFYYLKTT